MTFRRLHLPRFCAFVTLFSLAALTVLPSQAVGLSAHWVPAGTAIEDLSAGLTLHYDGLSGRLVVADADLAATLAARGATRVEFAEFERLYVYLVENAELAEFEAPARVLLRSGHEVLVETEGEAPSLTKAAIAALGGLRQPIRLSARPQAWVAADPGLPAQPREFDPLIQAMVDELSETSYLGAWQPLEDFVNRYYAAPQNELATQWILDQFISYGLDAEFHYYNQNGQRRNVVGTLPGLVDPDQIVYVVAHMDATSGSTGSCAPGADDNGSGSAAVIEAARILSQYQFEYTIKFVCFNGEEQGLVGSGAFCSDIAAAGEDLIGAFTMDMIAYRGTDPAPPDLVMYTNSGSVFLANAVADAVDTYLPGQLEPIILVENMTSSDHASFWANGYAAIVGAEDEAWGGDFSPWYHTCDDMIWRYPIDYPTWCAKANLAAVATTAIPLNPDGPYLVMASTTLDDDAIPPSAGDDDGTLNPGETIELWVELRNVGTANAATVSGQLGSTSGSVTIDVDSAVWNSIPQGGSGSNLTPFVFTVAGTALDGESIPFTLGVTSGRAFQELLFSFAVSAPDLAFWHHGLDDASPGNGNGVLDPGEILYIPVSLANRGGKEAVTVAAQLVSGSPHLNVIEGQGTAALIPAGGNAELAPSYRVSVSTGAPEDDILPMDLAISTAAGYQAASGYKLKVGSHFYDELEAEGAWIIGDPSDDASTGIWERVDPIGTTQDGQPCAPEDDYTAAPGTHCFVTGQGPVGGSAGGADVDGGKTTLISPSFDLGNVSEARVTYFRWYTNNLGNNPNEDEWVVQVSANGGTSWVDLERTTASNNSWQERSFLINDYVTPSSEMVFRFSAEDYGGGSLVEAGVDNFEVSGLMEPVLVSTADLPRTQILLAQAQPNPFRERTQIAFTLPTAQRASLKLYSVNGRLVRTLLDGDAAAGTHEIVWNGANDAGHKVVPGVYAYRLQVGGKELTRKLVLLH
jgi:hypothetical protein